jgi:hypothetical protein
MMRKSENSLTVNLDFTDQTETTDLQAYVFSSGGKPLGSAPISAREPAVISMPDNMDGRTIEVLLGPVANENEPAPTVSALKRAGAYTLPARYLFENPKIDIKIPGTLLPFWCTCNVNGRVINRVTLPDGSVDEMPVCNARVHICEVDPWYWILQRIPDIEILRLRDDLLEILYPERLPIPLPDPGPYLKRKPAFNATRAATRKAKIESSPEVLSDSQFADSSQQLALTALASTSRISEIRAQLLQLDYALYPYWCFFPYIWPYYRKDCIRTVDVDGTGRFSANIYHDCKDQPDLYFWVEQLQDGVWTTVYKPSIACHTHWNYVCGTQVVINAPSAEPCEVPGYDVPAGVTLFVLPYKIGYTPIWGTPAGAPSAPTGWLRSDGLVDYNSGSSLGMLYNAPFGGTLRFHHDDSYFIPKDDSDPGPGDSSIKFYRYSYRRVGDTGAWTAMTAPQSRGYRMEYNDSSLPTYESYPVHAQTVGGEPNLFEFKPRTPPVRVIDPPTVVVREWTSGNLNDIAASWNTRATAPAMDEINTSDDAGTFGVKIEVFNGAGQQVMPGSSTFEFLARNSDGTTTRYADTGEISNGAFVFEVHIDNNDVTAELPQPSIGGVQASDNCGFLRYSDPSDFVHVEFTATHPNDHAVFDFTIKRGSNALSTASTLGVYTETAVTSAPPYSDISGVYQHNFAVSALVGRCINAAFAADLDIWGKATDGRYRLGIHTRRLIAFALAESEDSP